MSTFSIPTNTTIEDLFAKVMPEIANEQLSTNLSADLEGTNITMVVEVENDKYSFSVKDGKELITSNDDNADAMLRLKIDKDNLTRMIESENLDMILGIQNDLNRVKYNALSSLKGSFTAEITQEEGKSFTMEAILNGASDPKCHFIMSAKDTAALMTKEVDPPTLFMTGQMQIEGDMAFAMATQPLFS